MALGKLCNWKLMNKKTCSRNIDEAINKLKSSYFDNKYEMIDELISQKKDMLENTYIKNGIEYNGFNDPLFIMNKSFEVYSWDVIIQTNEENLNSIPCKIDCLAYKYCYIKTNKIAVEIKPVLGDDYNNTFIQMKNNKFHPDYQCLVYETFISKERTLEEIKSYFATEGFKVFSFDEIEKAKQELFVEGQL